ncbi:hypothetical protein MASR2M74_27220 [Paracoccaceae bacterium]
MRTFLWIAGGFVLGAALALGIGVALPMITPVSQAEGAYAMGVVFFMMPAGAVLGALTGLAGRLISLR